MQNPIDLLEYYQESILSQVFGDMKWGHNKSDVTTPWRCPKCNSNHGFRRRGSRSKIIYHSGEKLNVRLFQVTCMSCGSTFSPFPEIMGLDKNERIYGDIFDFANMRLITK